MNAATPCETKLRSPGERSDIRVPHIAVAHAGYGNAALGTFSAMRDDDKSPISASDAKELFADWKAAPALLLAVSGGPDSVALMWLVARWRRALSRGPRLVAVTVDHGLRAEAAREAREVKKLARTLDIEHRTMRWNGTKPSTGVKAAVDREQKKVKC